MMKIRKGDEVYVLTGKDKGKRGKRRTAAAAGNAVGADIGSDRCRDHGAAGAGSMVRAGRRDRPWFTDDDQRRGGDRDCGSDNAGGDARISDRRLCRRPAGAGAYRRFARRTRRRAARPARSDGYLRVANRSALRSGRGAFPAAGTDGGTGLNRHLPQPNSPSSQLFNCDLGAAPTLVATGAPFLNRIIVGMPRTP